MNQPDSPAAPKPRRRPHRLPSRPKRLAHRLQGPARVLLVVLGLIAVALGAVAWRLVEYGLPLGFLHARLETALEAQLPGQQADIGAALLAWDKASATLLLQLRNTRIAADAEAPGAKAPIAKLPDIRLGFDPWQLLQRRIRLTRVILVGGLVDIERRADGSLGLGLANIPAEGAPAEDAPAQAVPALPVAAGLSTQIVPALVRRLTGASDMLSGLQRLEIRDVRLLLRRQDGGARLRLDGLRLQLRRAEPRLDWSLSTQVGDGADGWRLAATGRQQTGDASGEIRLLAEGLTPAHLPRLENLVPVPAALRALDLPVRAAASLNFGASGALEGAEMEIDLGPGDIRLAGLADADEAGLAVDSGRIRARLDTAGSRLLLDEASLAAGASRISLAGTVGLDAAAGYRPSRLQLHGEDMVVHLDGVTAAPVAVERLDLLADASLPDGGLHAVELDIERLHLQLPEGSVEISGLIRAAPESPELRLSIASTRLDKANLLALWPLPLETKTRDWVGEHVAEARLRDILIRLDMDAGALAATLRHGRPFADGALLMQARLHRLVLDYFPPLPPIRSNGGGLRVRDNRFAAWADEASLQAADGTQPIALADLAFEVADIHAEAPPSLTRLTFRGEADALLALLQSETIGLQQKGASIDAAGSRGAIAGALTLNLPLHDNIEAGHLDLDVQASGAGLLLPLAGGGYLLSGADLDFAASLEALQVAGTADINGVPVELSLQKRIAGDGAVAIGIDGDFGAERLQRLGISLPAELDGRIPAALALHGDRHGIHAGSLRMDLTPVGFTDNLVGWSKPKGQAAAVQMQLGFMPDGGIEVSGFSLRGEGVAAEGDFYIDAEARLQHADLPLLRIGAETSLSVQAHRRADGLLALDISGDSLDMRDMLDNLFGGEGLVGDEDEAETEAEEDLSVQTITSGRVSRLLAHDGVTLEDARFSLRQAGDHLAAMHLDANLNGAGFSLRLRTDPQGGGRRRLRLVSGDGGATLRGLDLYPHIVGGDLRVQADVAPIGAPLRISGRVTGGDYRIANAPGFARLLSLASLSGIAALLTQQGIHFQMLELPFEMTPAEIRLLDGGMSGTSLGLTLRGSIDTAAEQADLRGSLVPSYVLNSMLGHIPLLGDLIVGREGEGIFGVTFRISGPVDDTTIDANPLAVLTPGILRRLTEFGGTPFGGTPSGGTTSGGAPPAGAEAETATEKP